MLSRDFQKSRRKFMAVVGAGMAALAGCSSDGEDPEPTGTSNPTDSPTQPSENPAESTSEGTEEYSETEESSTTEETGTPEEDRQIGQETRSQNAFSEDGYSWIEIQNMDNLQLPDVALRTDYDLEENGVEDVSNYREFLDAIASSESLGGEADTYLVGWKDLTEYEGSGNYEGRIRRFESAIARGGDWGLSGGGNAEEGVVERFLQENVSGYVDHSEDIDEEMLEYAGE